MVKLSLPKIRAEQNDTDLSPSFCKKPTMELQPVVPSFPPPSKKNLLSRHYIMEGCGLNWKMGEHLHPSFDSSYDILGHLLLP